MQVTPRVEKYCRVDRHYKKCPHHYKGFGCDEYPSTQYCTHCKKECRNGQGNAGTFPEVGGGEPYRLRLMCRQQFRDVVPE
jgi:hypothetical protein